MPLTHISTEAAGHTGSVPLVPFHQFLWKVASRCNLDCSYCFVYHSADQRWREQPPLMSEETARQTSRRIRQHLQAHNKTDVSIVFHGGEPMLGGVKHLSMLLHVINEELRQNGIAVDVGMQSNLTLLSTEIADLLLRENVSIGTSLDGPPALNDLVRIGHAGEASSHLVERGLAILARPEYRRLWAGILSVMNANWDPIKVVDYLLHFDPPFVDFLFPLNNHDNLPPGKHINRDATPYGDWLIRAFDHWWALGAKPRVRFFEAIMRRACGLPSGAENIGSAVVDLVVVETNGDIEGVDALKSAFHGATALGFNVFGDSFDDVARHEMVRMRQAGVDGLCMTCQACSVKSICGGGYLPHRYSARTGFDNPSVYCRDLDVVIRHIYKVVRSSVNTVAAGKSAHDTARA